MSEWQRQVAEMNDALVRLQITLVDRLTPVFREYSFVFGKFGLAMYLAMPWHRRLWHDIRTGRFARNLRDAFMAWLP